MNCKSFTLLTSGVHFLLGLALTYPNLIETYPDLWFTSLFTITLLHYWDLLLQCIIFTSRKKNLLNENWNKLKKNLPMPNRPFINWKMILWHISHWADRLSNQTTTIIKYMICIRMHFTKLKNKNRSSHRKIISLKLLQIFPQIEIFSHIRIKPRYSQFWS